ncbi:hypothetical protein BX600DRAFT_470987 [Xylariales sp. PMI_506]|nr:hypothetical protein BX600DRAFT_470987 [Xylariales sp. PMI_506]
MLGSQAGQQEALVGNVAGHLGQADPKVREVAYGWFKKVDPELATRIEDEINKRVKQQDIPN